MSVDLSGVFTAAEAVARSAVETAGTRVSITRTSDGRGAGTLDRSSLTLTAEAPETVYADVPALLAPVGQGRVDGGPPRETEVSVGDYVVMLTVDRDQVREQDVVTVLASRDQRLVGRVLDVKTLLDSSAGAARVMYARPRDQGGPA